MAGTLSARHIVGGSTPAPLAWRLRNTLRWAFVQGWLQTVLARWLAHLGLISITSELRAILVRGDGERINYGVVSRRKVTQGGVGYLVDDWTAGTPRIFTMHYHASGTGTGAEANTDSALGTEVTDNARTDGTQSQPSANIMQSADTITYTGAHAITEHGIFNQATVAGSVLWDRSVFAAINVASTDSIVFTYQCTVNYEA